MLNKLMILFLLIFNSIGVAGTSDLRNQVLEANIKNSGEYRWGESIDTDPVKAWEMAKQDLSQKIYVAMSASTIQTASETEAELTKKTEVVIKSYSALHLQNLEKLIIPEKQNRVRVIAYISHPNLSLSFEASKQKVRDMVKLALQAESEGRIGDALKGLYWAYLLTHSYVGELDLGFEGIEIKNARMAISERMTQIVKKIRISSSPCYQKANNVSSALSFFYNDQPIQNIEFGYYCGDYDDFGYVENGTTAHITLYHPLTDHKYRLWLSLEYEYLSEMRNRPEIMNLYEFFKDNKFDLNVLAELTAPWIPISEPTEFSKTSKPKQKLPPKPAEKEWSTTIRVLADISDRSELDEALSDYLKSELITIGNEISDIPRNYDSYVEIVESNRLTLLYYDGSSYKNVKTGKLYSDYHEAYSGDAMIIWIGVPRK